LRLLLLAVLAAPAAAQTWFTSPVGLEHVDGDAESMVNPGSFAACRLQYIDGNQRGQPRPGIRALALRRDAGVPTTATARARTLVLGIVMAHADVAAPSAWFESNYRGGATQVYGQKPTSLPDLQAQGPAPAPWDVAVPFDRPFDYDGTADLLWELAARDNDVLEPYWLDCATDRSVAFGGVGGFRYVGQGCIVPPHRAPFELISGPPRTDPGGTVGVAWHSLPTGPPASPGVLALGRHDPGLPGLCAPLRAGPDVLLPFVTTGHGAVPALSARFALPGGERLQLHAQALVLHPATQTLWLTDATAHTILPYSAPVTRACTSIQHTWSDVATMGWFSSICLVARFEY
jgi:hypothetical protein